MAYWRGMLAVGLGTGRARRAGDLVAGRRDKRARMRFRRGRGDVISLNDMRCINLVTAVCVSETVDARI